MHLSSTILTSSLLYLATQTSALPLTPRAADGLFDQTVHLSLKTPIPAGVSNDAVLAILHDPVQMITLNPLVKSQSQTSTPGASPAVFTITDNLKLADFIPIGTTTYTATFTNKDDGMNTVVEASLGLKTTGDWKITDDGKGGSVLDEEVDVSGSAFIVPFVKGQIEDSHNKLHDALIKKVQGGAASRKV